MRNYTIILSFSLFFGFFLFSPSAHAASKKAKKAVAEESEDRGIAVVEKNRDGIKRVALVIGNSAYTNSPLKNPVNDAKDIAAKLRGLGFDVVERSNLKIKQIGGTLREFRSKLAPGAVALVFYAGHGLQIKGDNYLPAVDADINSEEDVHNQSLALKQIMDVLDESKSRLNLVFLDACRNNPYASSFRSAGKGLARVSAPSGTLVSYATKPGSVAADGTGRNGLYTSKLLAQMDSRQQIELSLKRVVTEVKAASKGKQEPWMEGSIEGDYCFGGCAESGGLQIESPSSVTSVKDDSEDALWAEVQKGNSKDDYDAYLTQYPNGPHAALAMSALWTEVQKVNRKDSYNAYLMQYPKSPYAALARTRIKKMQEIEDAAAKAEADASRLRQERDARYEKELAPYNEALRQYNETKKLQTDSLEKYSKCIHPCSDKIGFFNKLTKDYTDYRQCMAGCKSLGDEFIKYNNLFKEAKMPVAPVKPE
jgi:Caspase domain